MAALCTGYGGDIKMITSKNKKSSGGKMIIYIEKAETGEKLFSPSRFDGTNFLVKRQFKKKKNEETGKFELMYSGHAKVPVSLYTPIKFDYDLSNNHMRVTFYIQRYSEEGFAVDSAVQQLINQEMVDTNEETMSISE